MMESFKIVGAKIVNLRDAKKLTQEQLAEKAEIPIAVTLPPKSMPLKS